MRIDAIIPTRNRIEEVERCIRSLFAAASFSKEQIRFRALVCASGGHPEMSRLLDRLQTEFSELLVLRTKDNLSAAQARNAVMTSSNADWLLFIDDDAFVDVDFFATFLDVQDESITVIGGPNLTPADSSTFQRASGAVLASRFGASTSSARYWPRLPTTIHCSERVLISCNLFVRRSAMEGLKFPDGLRANEENWLMQDLIRRSGTMVYVPQLFVWHERRPTWRQLASQIYSYGIGRGQNLRLRPNTFCLMHLIPSFGFVFTLTACVLAPWRTDVMGLWLILAATYLALWIGATARLRENGWTVRLLGASLFPLVHVAYGIGVLRGLVP